MPDSKVLINSGYMTLEQIEKENLVILEKRLGLDGIHQRLTNLEETLESHRRQDESQISLKDLPLNWWTSTEQLKKNVGLPEIGMKLMNLEGNFDHIREVLRNLGKEVSKIEEKLRNHQGIVSHDGRTMSELEQKMVILQQQIEYIFKYTPVTNDAVKTLQKDVEELKNNNER